MKENAKWNEVNNRIGGVKGVIKMDNGEKKLPRLVQYDMRERDVAEWAQTKKEFAKRYNLKKIIDCKVAFETEIWRILVMNDEDEDFQNQDDFKDLEDIINQKLEENLELTTKLSTYFSLELLN